MHERMELKTHRLSVMLTTAWPMVLALLITVGASLLMMPWQLALLIGALLFVIALITFVICVRMYMGKYVFQPRTEVHGARIVAKLGMNEVDIHGVSAAEIIVKQDFVEKALGVCHIRQKGTAIFLRGVPEVEKVKAWIAANFPEKTVGMRNLEEKEARSRKKRKNGKK